MGFWDKFFGREEITVSPDEPQSNAPAKENPRNILELGWYWSENKQEHQLAKINQKDRATHFYVIGATGTGKSKFLEFLIQQDIRNGNGFGVIDPHGDLIEDVKGFLAADWAERNITEKIVLIDPLDPKFTVTFNPLERLPNVSIPEQAGELISAFKKIWSDSWGVRMEDLLRNSLIALGEGGFTFPDLSTFLTNRPFRKTVLEKVSHPIAREYFQRFQTLTDRGQITWIEPIMNKINAFLSDDRIRQMFSSGSSSFRLRDVMDNRKVLLVKLNKGKLKGAADLLGSLLMSMIQMAAFSRSDLPQEKRTPFYLYIDEFQNFASESFAVVLSEARKYGLSLVMAHQTLAQIPDELRSLILGNTGVQVYFRLNRQDASLLAKESFEYSGFEVKTMSNFNPKYWSFAEEWEHKIEELQGLPPRCCYAKHKIEGGMIALETVEIEQPRETLGMNARQYEEYLSGLGFGAKYLVAREIIAAEITERRSLNVPEDESAVEDNATPSKAKEKQTKKRPTSPTIPTAETETNQEGLSAEEKTFLEYISQHPSQFVTQMYQSLGLSGYRGDRLKEQLIEKGMIVQEETREGKGGRLAKKLKLTATGVRAIGRLTLVGKGGDEHRQWQLMISEQAEVFGFVATIEERIGRTLESVDVGLRKGDMSVAVEICSTTKSDHEMQNIRKCLEAGYDYVVSVSDDKHISSLKAEAKKYFNPRERERIRFLAPERVKDFLKTLGPAGIVSENSIVSGQVAKQKTLLDMNEAAEYLGISKNTLYEWVVQRKIPHLKVGRLTKFKRDDLESWLKTRTQQENNRDFG